MNFSGSGFFDADFVPVVHFELGVSQDSMDTRPLMLDTGFNGMLALSESTLASMTPTQGPPAVPTVSTGPDLVRTVLTMNGEVDLPSEIVFVRWDEHSAPEMVDALICHIDAIGNEFLEGSQLDMPIERAGHFRVLSPSRVAGSAGEASVAD